MRLRSFTAPTMAEAMSQVREALGPDAIIVSTHQSRRGRGVQVTAAIEAPAEEQALDEALFAPEREDGRAADPLSDMLAYHGVPARIAARLTRAARELRADDAVTALAGAIDGYIAFDPLPELPNRPLLLVGPPGAGKTVTVAKLATRGVLAGGRVTVATTDIVRAGAVAQLEAFTSLLRQPLMTLERPEQLARAIQRLEPDAPLLVDTPGTNPFDREELADLGRFVAAAGDRAEPVLVLSAGGDADEAAEIATAFRRLGCRRLLVTRLDGARRLGAMLSAAVGAGLALSEVSITASVAQGLRTINPMSLARVLTRDPMLPHLGPDFGV